MLKFKHFILKWIFVNKKPSNTKHNTNCCNNDDSDIDIDDINNNNKGYNKEYNINNKIIDNNNNKGYNINNKIIDNNNSNI